jgi:hypothetical protein
MRESKRGIKDTKRNSGKEDSERKNQFTYK